MDIIKFSWMKYKRLYLVAVIVLLLISIGGCSTDDSSLQVNAKENWTEVGNSIYIFTSDFYLANITLVVSNGEGILIDTGANKEDQEKIQQFLKENNIKLSNIIITHKHMDHYANINALKTEDMIPVTPENAKQGQQIQLGDKTLRIIFTEGHFAPKGHISVELLEDNVLIAGDVICNGIVPPVSAGGNLFDLMNTLEELQKHKYSLIIPGHGDIVPTKKIFQINLGYLENAKQHVEQLMAKGGKITDLKGIKLEDCLKDTSDYYKENLEGWHLKNLHKIYLDIKTKTP